MSFVLFMEIIFEGSVVGIRLSSLFVLARLAFGGWCFGVRLSSLFGLARLARSASPRLWGAAPYALT